VWSGERISTSRSLADGSARQPQISSITPVNDGNVFIVGVSTFAGANTTNNALSLWGTTTTTVPAGTVYSPPQIFKFRDVNGTFSNYGAFTGTSTTGETRQFGVTSVYNGVTATRIPGSSDSVRVMTIANYPDLTINTVAAANLNTSNALYIPLRFDMNSANVITNFRGQLPLISQYNVPAGTSAGLSFGPSNLRNSLGLIGVTFRAAKTANV
jgi:hypothetical protein